MLIFYDGNCPVCCAKRDFLMRRDKQGVLAFSDIRADDFQPVGPLPDIDALAFEIHALKADGSVIRGMDVMRAAYAIIGIGWLLAPTGWPLFRPLFDRLYAHIARNRLFYSKWLFGRKR